MKTRNDLWVWIDLEMTGLDTSKDVIIEIGSAITDWDLNPIAEGPQIVIGQPEALLTGMDDQLARCKVAEKEGWGYVLEKRDANSIDLAISNLLNKVGERKPLEGNSGAIEVAENLISRIK